MSAWQFEQLTVIIDADFRACRAQRIPQGNLVCSEYRSAEVVLQRCYYANGAEGVPADENGLRRGGLMYDGRNPPSCSGHRHIYGTEGVPWFPGAPPVGRSPLIAHASESDRMNPAMRAARASAYLRRERWVLRVTGTARR